MLEYLNTAIAAYNAVLITGKSYQLTNPDGSSQQVTRANLPDIEQAISYWQSQIDEYDGKRGPVYVRPKF